MLPGQADDVVTVHLGYGRTRAGRVGNGAGFDAYALRTSDAPWFGDRARGREDRRAVHLACTQDHWSMERRERTRSARIVRAVTKGELEKDQHAVAEMGHEPPRELACTRTSSTRATPGAWPST